MSEGGVFVLISVSIAGTKALNKTHLPSSNLSYKGDSVAFVTVFTVYNTSLDSHPDGRSVNLIKVGNASYSKTERSMAILNVFINFIQVTTQCALCSSLI